MDIDTLDARLKAFRLDHCGMEADAEVPLRFLSDMCWALGLAIGVASAPRIEGRAMVRGDIYPPD